MTLTIGWWLAPLTITAAAIGTAIWQQPKSSGDYDFSPLFGCGMLLLAIIVSLVAWLIWALAA